jgi:protoheme ferro-lyase
MRHWAPLIEDVVEQARKDGVERLVGFALAPQYSRDQRRAYHAELEKTGHRLRQREVLAPRAGAPRVLERVTQGKRLVLYTAHSIPSDGRGAVTRRS